MQAWEIQKMFKQSIQQVQNEFYGKGGLGGATNKVGGRGRKGNKGGNVKAGKGPSMYTDGSALVNIYCLNPLESRASYEA